jgi:hypothetical protein
MGEQADGLKLRRRPDIRVPRDHVRRHAARGDKSARSHVSRHLGLVLVGRIAVAVGDDDLVAREQGRASAVRAFDAPVLSDCADARENHVTRTRRSAGIG